MINILITSAGRRVEFIQEFLKASKNNDNFSHIVCADMDELSPALYFASEFYKVPALSDPDYISVLLEICKKEAIKLIIPTIDTELEILSNNTDLFKEIGVDVLVSSSDTLKITRDKIETYHFFKSLSLKTPESYEHGMIYQGSFPCFIKPRSGSSSINTFKVKNDKELEFFKYYIGDYIIQEFIEGEEYTVDVFCDFNGNPIFITPRIRLATRSGEVLKTRVQHDKHLEKLVLQIISSLMPKGPLTIQAIKNKLNGEYYFIEINSRFGGGCPLSFMAGANSAKALINLLKGENIEYKYGVAKEGFVFLRFDQSIILEKKEDGSYEKY